MKPLKLIALAAFALFFSQCKTTAPTAPSGPTPLLSEVTNILDTTQSKFLQFADSTNGNPWQAVMLTSNWLKTQPNVQSATVLDSLYINITLKSGLKTSFHFDQIGADSLSIFRGGGGSVSSKTSLQSRSGTLSLHTITNKKVLVYSAAVSNFYAPGELQAIVGILSGSPVGLDVTLLENEQCTYQMVDNFRDYGLVIIDTHGGPDVFQIGSKITMPYPLTTNVAVETAAFDQQLGTGTHDKFTSDLLRLGSSVFVNIKVPFWYKTVKNNGVKYNVLLTTKYINGLLTMPNTIVFGDMCYSGYSVQDPTFLQNYPGETPMQTAWMNKNPICYYCFAIDDGTSASVNSHFANTMFDTLARRLAVNTDSTNIANLQSDNFNEFSDPTVLIPGRKLWFSHSGKPDYSYPPSDSFVDARDGQVYREIKIGTQTWMAQNLNYNAPGSECYDNDPKNCTILGKLYPWNVAMAGAASDSSNPSHVQGVCPKGWHIPSLSEWNQLIVATGANGDINAASRALRSTSTDTTAGGWGAFTTGISKATNSTGFSALPGGAFGWQNTPLPSGPLARVYGLKSITGRFQSSTLASSGPWVGFVNGIEIAGDIIPVYRFFGDKDQQDPEQPPMNASCRCVKDP